MSFDVAISVKNISKCYLIYDRPQDRLKQSLWRGRRRYYREFWALKDVSFEVKKGETMGIIGRNGSGKSTLLQIIAGTITPNSGEVRVSGRVAALLELGSGFNPEFTGRENVFMNGAILGLDRKEMEQRFDDIAAFADIGEFIDQPVKTYSSGMVVRLAFAVQAFVPKEVLIVDEALAVGDELFQRKCFAKIEEFKKKGGTILFVSHDGAAVVQLCNRALLLESGELVLSGPSKQVVNLYQKFLYAPASRKDFILQEARQLSKSWLSDEDTILKKVNNIAEEAQIHEEKITSSKSDKNIKDVSGPTYDPYLVPKEIVNYETRGAHIFDAEILTIGGKRVNLLLPGERYIWKYCVRFDRDCENVRFGMLIKTLNGMELGGAATAQPFKGIPLVRAGTIIRVEFEFRANLASGTYFLNAGVLGLAEEGEVYLDRRIDLAAFKILPREDSLVTAIVDFGIIPQVYQLDEINRADVRKDSYENGQEVRKCINQ